MTLREVISSATRLAASNSMRNASKTLQPASRPPKSTAKQQTDIRTLIKAVEVIEIYDSDEETQDMKTVKEASKRHASNWPPRRGKSSILDVQPSEESSEAGSHSTETGRAPAAAAPVKQPKKARTSISNNSIVPSRATPPLIHKRTIAQTAASPSEGAPTLLEDEMMDDPVLKVLPKYSYKDYTKPKAHRVYTTDEGEANDFIDSLRPGPVAMDMEWQVVKITGAKERRTALVQVADVSGLIVLIQVYDMNRFPLRLIKLLEDSDVPKLGANILNDGKKLFRDYGILSKNLVELGAVAQIVDPEGQKSKRKVIALAKLVEAYCGKELEKGSERTSNWEKPLNELQCEYAANDVHCSIQIYQRLLEIGRENGKSLADSPTIFSANVQMLFESPPISRSSSTESATSATSTTSGSSVKSTDTEITIPDAEEPAAKPAAAPPMQRKPSGSCFESQQMRAYRFWHKEGMELEKMCKALSLKGQNNIKGKLGEPLKPSTVISYVIGALTSDPSLPFDMRKLRELVQMDIGSWVRHKEWICEAYQQGRGMPPIDEA